MMKQNKKGFTLVELIVVMGIVAILSSISAVSLLSLQRKNNLASEVDTFVSAVKEQQLKAMTGDTGNAVFSGAYGIFLNQNSYVLFHGTVYQENLSTNHEVFLNGTVSFSNVTFPSSTIVFATVSGEIINFASGSSNLVLRDDANGDEFLIGLNKYGAITVQ